MHAPADSGRGGDGQGSHEPRLGQEAHPSRSLAWPIDGIPVPVLVLSNGELVGLNRAWCEAAWWGMPGMNAGRWFDAVDGDDRSALMKRICAGDEREPAPVRMIDGSVHLVHIRRVRSADRSPVLVTLVPYVAGGNGRFDSLTGLFDGAVFYEDLRRRVEAPARGCTAVLFADLDGFKQVNDRHGHLVGNEVLVTVSRRISSVLAPTDVVARLGGDEFGVVCCRPTIEDVARLAEGIVSAVAQPMEVGRSELVVTVSVGIAVADGDDGSQGASIVDRADRAMYRAKADGRAHSRLFDPGFDADRTLLAEACRLSNQAAHDLTRSEQRVMDLWSEAIEQQDHPAAAAALAAQANRLRHAAVQMERGPVSASSTA